MTLRERIHEIVFEADTPAGKAFDVVLLIAIVLSILVVVLESVKSLGEAYGLAFGIAEWSFTVIFTLEYLLRVVIIKRPLKYIISFYGLVDLLSILPTYIGLFVSGAESLLILRSLRLLRVFRVMKLTRYLSEADTLGRALVSGRRKISVFLLAVVMVTIIMGTVMFMIEGGEPDTGFTSIPASIYWAIVTLTTVGYGDISPTTPLGQVVASIIMILGYAIIAVPTGIVTAELAKPKEVITNTQNCSNCGEEDHMDGAVFCHNCGERL